MAGLWLAPAEFTPMTPGRSRSRAIAARAASSLGGGRSFLPVPDWIRFVVTGWLQVGNTGFQQSLADVLHIRLLGIVQGGDK